jgi:hypothetical protein
VALDERLRRELERSARPADPTGVYEQLIRRKERRRLSRTIQTSLLAVGVIVGSAAGVVLLSRVFEPADSGSVVGPSPVPITLHANGRLAYSLASTESLELHTAAPDGSDDRVIPTPRGMPWLPAWSPDGSRLAVAIFPSDDGDRAIWVMKADGSDPRRIAAATNVSVPSWSPDGSTIAYTARTGGRTEIHLVAPDGSGDRVIHGEGAEGTFAIFSAQFSPDGRQILFDRGTDTGFDIFVMDVDGTNVRRLTTTGTDYDPHWSPDGTRIAFTRQGVGPQSNIYVMDADGSNGQQLTDGGEGVTNLYPQWSPDGSKIAYVAGVTGGPGPLVVMNADGSQPETVVPRDVLGIAWQPLPDDSSAPTPSPTESPELRGEDIGLGFPVCNVSSIEADFVESGVPGIAYVATRVGDSGRCPAPEDASDVVALDGDGDGTVDTSYGPIECTLECRTFSAPDLDGDGTAELLVVQDGGAVVGLGLYDVAEEDGAVSLEPVVVAPPGDPEGGFEPGVAAKLWLGGDAFELYTLRCGDPEMRHGPGLVVTTAESLPHDSPDALWHAHRVVFALVDGSLRLMDIGDFTEPAGFDPPSFQSDETLCGSNLGP